MPSSFLRAPSSRARGSPSIASMREPILRFCAVAGVAALVACGSFAGDQGRTALDGGADGGLEGGKGPDEAGSPSPEVLLQGLAVPLDLQLRGDDLFLLTLGTELPAATLGRVLRCPVASCKILETVMPDLRKPSVFLVVGDLVYIGSDVDGGYLLEKNLRTGATSTIEPSAVVRALSADSDHVYYSGTFGVRRIARASTSVGPASFVTTAANWHRVASVAEADSEVALVNQGAFEGGGGSVQACPRSACPSPRVVAAGELNPAFLARRGAELFWLSYSQPEGAVRATTLASDAGVVRTLATTTRYPIGLRLENDGRVVWSEPSAGKIRSVKPGEPARDEALYPNAGASVETAEYLYWVARNSDLSPDGRLLRQRRIKP